MNQQVDFPSKAQMWKVWCKTKKNNPGEKGNRVTFPGMLSRKASSKMGLLQRTIGVRAVIHRCLEKVHFFASGCELRISLGRRFRGLKVGPSATRFLDPSSAFWRIAQSEFGSVDRHWFRPQRTRHFVSRSLGNGNGMQRVSKAHTEPQKPCDVLRPIQGCPFWHDWL